MYKYKVIFKKVENFQGNKEVITTTRTSSDLYCANYMFQNEDSAIEMYELVDGNYVLVNKKEITK